MTVHLELVDCEPYRVRLREEACVERHRLANGTPKGRTAKAREIQQAKHRFRLCIGCEVGATRAAGDSVGDVHLTEPRSPEPPPVIEPPAPAPTPPKKEKTVKTKTCAVDGCDNDFDASKPGNRRYCDAHRDPKSRPKKRRAKKTKPRAAVVEKPEPGPKGERLEGGDFASPKELLELAGFDVEEVATPRGVMLLVVGAA